MKTKLSLLVILLALITGLFFWRHDGAKPADAQTNTNNSSKTKTVSKPAAQPQKTATAEPSECQSAAADQTIIVSLSQQHLWACSGQSSVYDTPVTTGATAYGDGTPTGTWAVYSKQTDRHLTGSDDRGSWDDFVNYWMPFYGDYGFHDATWQTFAFGSLTDYQTGGSHGCVHLPLAAMKWLYNWSAVGTAVTVQA